MGPFAATPLGDIEACVEHPFGEAVRVGDLGRDHRIAVGIQILDVALQAEITNFVPKTVKAHLGCVRSFRHDDLPRSDHPSLRRTKVSHKAGLGDYCPEAVIRIVGLDALSSDLKPRMSCRMPRIRTATPKDLRTIATLERNWAREGSMIGFVAGGIAGFAGYIDSTDKSLWVAESQADIVGYVSTTIHKTSGFAVVPNEDPYVEIDDLYVSPGYRSRSLGSRLVEAVLDAARARGIRYATAFTSSSRVAEIMRFYENQGFEPWGIQFFRKI